MSGPPASEAQPVAPPSTPVSERAALSRDYSDFLLELSIALHKFTMYPEGHPSVEPAITTVIRRAEQLLESRATLALGVARNQLVVEGVATDSKNPLLADLAGRLHRHHLGAVTLHRGIRFNEVADLLRVLAVDAERSQEPLGLKPQDQLTAWPHVRLHPVTYERLALLDKDSPESGDDPASRERTLRGTQLWVGLASAALRAEPTEGGSEPDAIARAIDEQSDSEAYDQVIVGHLLQIADELTQIDGKDAAALRRRTSTLLGALQPGTLRRLIEMGGDKAQRGKFARAATEALAVDAVLEIVRAMADAAHKSVSEPLLRMLSKLAHHAEHGPAEVRAQADEALRGQVRELLDGWTLEDPNPTAYGHALHRMSAATPAGAAARNSFSQPAEPLRVVQIALETGVLGVAAWRAVDRLVAERQVGKLVELLAASPPTSQAPVRADIAPLWTRVTSPDVVGELATTEPPDFTTLDRVLPRLSAAAFESLLDVLAASESRTTRRGLLDRLTRAPTELGPAVAERLRAEIPWYVARNLLIVLDGLAALPDGFSASTFVWHADVRVRREALKVALKIPGEREVALLGGLCDADPRILRVSLSAALDQCPPSALQFITRIAQDDTKPSELRVLAIKVLGRAANPAARAALLALVDGGTNWLGRRRLAARSLELLAALMALAAGWAADHQASALLSLAAKSADPDIRNAAASGPRAARQ